MITVTGVKFILGTIRGSTENVWRNTEQVFVYKMPHFAEKKALVLAKQGYLVSTYREV